MRVLFDISHPAHVHFYKNLYHRLHEKGHAAAVLAREKDVTTDLLTAYGMRHETHGRSERKSRVRQAQELVGRNVALHRLALRFRPDFILSRSPAGLHVAPAVGAIGVFDTDDGSRAGLLFWAAAPLADIITTPLCHDEDYGSRHRRYPGYKALAYLHPNHFRPDPSIVDRLGLAPGEPYFLLRKVAHEAVHDFGAEGLSPIIFRRCIAELEPHGRVFISSERPLSPDLRKHALPTEPREMHDVIASASMFMGDSASMAAEAALLGTPSIYFSTFSGRLTYLSHLEQRFGLLVCFRPEEREELMRILRRWAGDTRAIKQAWRSRRKDMLARNVDVAEWYYDLILALQRPRSR